MSTRNIFLVIYPGARGQRAHFGIWVPDEEGAQVGTIIHVIGSPMAGFLLEFKRGYKPSETRRAIELVQIGSVLAQHLHPLGSSSGAQDTPRNNLERAATQIQPPRASANFLAPVNDSTNRRCQEWTMDYVRHLFALKYLNEAAINIVQSKRDPPHVGIGLRPAAAAHPQQAQTTTQQGQQQSVPAATGWTWDSQHQRYRRWDGTKWVWQE